MNVYSEIQRIREEMERDCSGEHQAVARLSMAIHKLLDICAEQQSKIEWLSAVAPR